MATTTTAVTSSLDRSKEFQKCCATAMGFEWVDQFDPDEVAGESASNSLNQGNGGMFDDNNNGTIHDGFDGTTHGTQGIHQIINLLTDDDEDRYDDDDDEDDGGGDEDRAGNSYDNTTLWMENAKRISQDLTNMSVWIQSKALKYVGLDMQDDEASLIQSTITTFAASTASELETLREMNNNLQNQPNNRNKNLINHRAGIVQILLMKLQDEITTPFSKLQKQRTRIAVKIWQHPLQCRLYHQHHQHKKNKRNQFGAAGAAGGNAGSNSNTSPSRSTMEELLFDDDDEYDDDGYNQKDQKFYPKHQGHGEGTNSISFIQKYARRRQQQHDQEGNQSVEPQPPDFVQRLAKRQRLLFQQQQQQQQTAKMKKNHDDTDVDDHSDSDRFDFGGRSDFDQLTGKATKEAFQQPHTIQPPQMQQHQHQQPMALPYQEQLATDLEEETMQLATEMIATSDLDSVQKMEQKMVQITTLIGQFSNLVQEQQEQIVSVHESAIETKENIEKGQENLVDATERTKRSKHYKAMVIFAMGFILLFFHILRN